MSQGTTPRADGGRPPGRPVTLRPLTADDLDEAAQVLGAAFRHHPNAVTVARGRTDRSERLMEELARAVELVRPSAVTLVAVVDGAIVGVGSAEPWPTCRRGALGAVRATGALVQTVGIAGLVRALGQARALRAPHPSEPHWHVGPIGIRPDRQGFGAGSALMAALLDRADAAGLPAYLETDVDRNVSLYERFGYLVIAERRTVAVHKRCMWRPPPGAGTAWRAGVTRWCRVRRG